MNTPTVTYHIPQNPVALVSAIIALNAVVLPAVLVLHFLIFRHVKAEGDPVRSGFKWLHPALFTFFVSTALETATYAYILAVPFIGTRDFREYFANSNRLGYAQLLASIVAEATLVFCVLRLVSSATTTPRRVFGYVITAALGLAVAGGIAVFGYGVWMAGFRDKSRDAVRNGTADPRKEMERLLLYHTTMSSVRLTVSILMMLAAAGVFTLAMNARKAGTWVVRKLAVVAGVVLFIMVWRFVYTMLSVSGQLPGTHGLNLNGVQYVDIILAVWGSFGALVMIYLVGKKREGGLWSETRGKVERNSEEGVTA